MHRLFYGLTTFIAMFGLLLGSWNNHVALYAHDDPTPLEVYPVQLSLLPKEDQTSLLKGIPVSDGKELQRLLEDLLS